MAKTRISISLDRQQAERIREHAERAGMDRSAYLVHAATRQMAESDAIEEQFAEVDAAIARAEAEAGAMPDETEADSAELAERQRRDVEAALALVHGADQRGATTPGHAA
ncbi:ribbon-helix-helix protein, CopG family [Streptomyces californicus]|uniref:ribbon-helix-helix protein, CopG family n=1 Tax=Streptomyces californicus TaxID=67351 RepID=UPI0037A88461